MKKPLPIKFLRHQIFAVSLFAFLLFSFSGIKAFPLNSLHGFPLKPHMDFSSFAAPGAGDVNDDTSKLDIQDTIKTIASHLPAMYRYANSGKEYRSNKYSYTDDCYEATKKWVNDYPTEADNFYKSVLRFLNTTDTTNLSTSQIVLFEDIKAQMIIVIQTK